MEDSIDELDPLFDYSRVQPIDNIALPDDDDSDAGPVLSPKRRKTCNPAVEGVDGEVTIIDAVNCPDKDEEDWLPPPPKVSGELEKRLGEDSTIKELRLKKQELVSVAKSAEEEFRAVDEPVNKTPSKSLQASLDAVSEKSSNFPCKRAKVVISIQDKDGSKQFRMYKDEKFERLFKSYADKVKLDIASLVFSFDGDKINLMATPDGLGMEDNDIIEVYLKTS